jgi:hypothetical protein
MGNKVHGTSFSDQALVGGLVFYQVKTLVNITPSADADPAAASQIALDKLIEVISTRAQPVILGAVTSASVAATSVNTDLPAAGSSGNVTVYSIQFAVEHAAIWEATPSLASSLDGIAGFVFTSPTTSNNVHVAVKTF